MAVARRRLNAELAPVVPEEVESGAEIEGACPPEYEPKAKFSPLLKTIVGYVFVLESAWEEVFCAIRDGLALNAQGKATDLPHLHHMATRMLLTWKREESRWGAENEVEWASMRKGAIRALTDEKAEGGKKTINKDDVEAQCALMYEDQYRVMRLRETEIKLTREYLEGAVRTIELAIRVRTSG